MLNPDIKAKKSAAQKRDRERNVVSKLKKSLVKLAKHLDCAVKVDHPSASEYGTAGRPDLYCYLGPFHFMVEVKRDDKEELSGVQKVWHDNYNHNHTDLLAPPLFVLYGTAGTEALLAQILTHYKLRQKYIRWIQRFMTQEEKNADN